MTKYALHTLILVLGIGIGVAVSSLQAAFAQERGFAGGIVEDRSAAAAKPIPVRNDVAQAGKEIVTFRHFRIEKGRFDEFYQASEQGVWPYFEKLGSRVVGMWKRIHPVVDGVTVSEESAEFDDVYLMTRYASIAHWRATRDMAAHGGNGPDWAKCREATSVSAFDNSGIDRHVFPRAQVGQRAVVLTRSG